MTQFDPELVEIKDDGAPAGPVRADGRDGRVYVYTQQPQLILAVKVALATQRPLLLSGPSGCGKSALAQSVARTLKRRYYEHVVTSRTEAADLLWRFDAIRRLNDAQAGRIGGISDYVDPGVLWWAFDQIETVDRVRRSGRKDPCFESHRATTFIRVCRERGGMALV